jgi:membrane-bound lytic murein transglycosylase B
MNSDDYIPADDGGIDPAESRVLAIANYLVQHGPNSMNREQWEALADYASAQIQDMDVATMPIPFPFTLEAQ